jgi:hypothetical protein
LLSVGKTNIISLPTYEDHPRVKDKTAFKKCFQKNGDEHLNKYLESEGTQIKTMSQVMKYVIEKLVSFLYSEFS